MIFGGEEEENYSAPNNEKQFQIATCALFLELAYADDEFASEEKDLIINVMKKTFNLNDDEVNELIKLAEEQINNSVSIYEFTNIINEKFDSDQKYAIVENLWRLIFVDKKFHAYEDYFIHKIVNNLHLSHKDMIAAKMKAKEQLKMDN
ncbi:MAG: TerB family tellurite resistance protein [Chlorobi bacterium]|nr:TerB family tellurite resistance protein [Chlorobiota bacterium]